MLHSVDRILGISEISKNLGVCGLDPPMTHPWWTDSQLPTIICSEEPTPFTSS
jgi:hypothetical protein